MPVSQNKAVSAQGLITGQAVCTLAKSTYNDAANAQRLIAAAQVPNGGLIYKITAQPRMTVTAVQLQLYRSKDAGVTLSLIGLITMGAYTMAQTTSPTQVADFGYTESIPLRLALGEELWCAIGVGFATGILFDATGEAL